MIRNILVCPDSFKGSLTACEAAEAMRQGVLDADPDAEVCCIPLADGGEGTAAILGRALGAEKRESETVDALGRSITAEYYMTRGLCPTAVIDVASAIGLTLIPEAERDVMSADSRGAGLLVADAARRGATGFVIGLGGSACCDGGRGMYEAMRGKMPGDCGRITVLCDVDNPLYGSSGAAYVFAPQKGASPAQVRTLDRRLREWNRTMAGMGGTDVSEMPGAGAAGGIAGMLVSMFGAKIVRGIDYVMEVLGMEQTVADSDMVLTGEGCVDAQTLHGKTLSGVLACARRHRRPVLAFGGSVRDNEIPRGTFDSVTCITPAGTSLEEAMRPDRAAYNLRRAVSEALKTVC